MASALHKDLGPAQVHVAYAFEYADSAARTGATGLVVTDNGKFARQLDNNSIWMLADYSGPVWQRIDGSGGVAPTVQVIAGAGLTGGGNLSSDVTINAAANADGSIVVNANDIQVGTLATDAQHGTRGGGSQHSAATAAIAGFMSATDKNKLDGAVQTQLAWGNSSVAATTTTRFLSPYWGDNIAGTTATQIRVSSSGLAQNLRVRHNVAAGNGNAIVYTLRRNGVATAVSVSMASTSADGSDLSNSVSLAAGDLLDIQVSKALSVGTSPTGIVVTLELKTQ